MAPKIVDGGNIALVGPAKKKMPSKTELRTWAKTALPFLNFAVNQVFEVDTYQPASRASQRLQPLCISR
jgi:hypothetical protein